MLFRNTRHPLPFGEWGQWSVGSSCLCEKPALPSADKGETPPLSPRKSPFSYYTSFIIIILLILDSLAVLWSLVTSQYASICNIINRNTKEITCIKFPSLRNFAIEKSKYFQVKSQSDFDCLCSNYYPLIKLVQEELQQGKKLRRKRDDYVSVNLKLNVSSPKVTFSVTSRFPFSHLTKHTILSKLSSLIL